MNAYDILQKREALNTERFKNTIAGLKLDEKINKLDKKLIESVKKKQ